MFCIARIPFKPRQTKQDETDNPIPTMSQMKASDLAIVKSLPGNDKCAECGMKHPQWASVSFGTLFCLECSGIHRSLGVHISFVRSIAMDSWTESQLQIMRCGGNDRCNDYLKNNGVERVLYSTSDAVNGGIKAKYDNDVALLYKLKLKARAEGKPEPNALPKKNTVSSGGLGGSSSLSSKTSNNNASGNVDPNGMERLPGETDSQYIARQTRLREEAKARMAAKFGNGGNGMNGGKRVMGGIGSSPHPSQQGGVGLGGFNLDSLSSGLASVTSTATSGLGSAWSLARETVNQTASSRNVNNASSIGSGVSEFGSSLWNSLSQVSQEINSVVYSGANDEADTFSELNQRMKAERSNQPSSFSGFGSQDLMAKQRMSNNNSGNTASRTTNTSSATSTSSNVDVNSIAALPNETDQQYMERQLRIQQEAKARLAAKFGDNPNQAMKKMSVGGKTASASKTGGGSDDFFASFGT